jgi:hypothetical protein
MTTRELDANDLHTRLRCAGPATDRDAVVFVRGNPGSGSDWELPLATVGDHGHRAVARDTPGFGRARWIRMTTATLRVRRPRLAALSALALVATALAGCGAEDREPSAATPLAAGTYAARVPGTDAYLAAVLDRGHVAAYLCDRGGTALWFAPRPHRAGRAELRWRSGRARLALAPAAGGVRARVRLPDGTLRTMTLAHQTGRAGIYRATASTQRGGLKAGWIVLDDGTQRGTTTQFIDPLSDLARNSAAPRLDTATGTVKFATAGTVTATKLTEPRVIDIDLDR